MLTTRLTRHNQRLTPRRISDLLAMVRYLERRQVGRHEMSGDSREWQTIIKRQGYIGARRLA